VVQVLVAVPGAVVVAVGDPGVADQPRQPVDPVLVVVAEPVVVEVAAGVVDPNPQPVRPLPAVRHAVVVDVTGA
jgi:hypothetical protein